MSNQEPFQPKLRLGVDIGGTFTDFALVDMANGMTTVHKQLTTPSDPSRAVLEGVEAILAASDFSASDVGEIVHGTTLVTNALIERKGAVTGLLVTDGFRDLFDIGREQRYDLFDLRIRFAEPLVPRTLRVDICERMEASGQATTPLDEDAVKAAVRTLVTEHGIQALAICYLHSYANPAHEERTRDIVADLYPELYVSTSADVFPYMREFERWTTTTVNAYTQPMVDRYLLKLERGLSELGFRGRLTLMSSSGGALTPSTARRYPVRLLESGPAAGVLMSCRLARGLSMPNVLSFDIGGTTAKGALVRGGRALKKYEFEAAHVYKHKSGSGLALRIPAIDLTEIGAGGGSIAEIDVLGLLRVGPNSAGAEPGPACYGQGGEQPTLTDANLVLGYLDPRFFLGGRMQLEPGRAMSSIATHVAQPLRIDVMRAAWGIHDITNEQVARAFRMHATERGFDCRHACMVAFGGGGPLHGTRIARKLRIPQVVFPVGAGVMSALGMLASRMSFEVARSLRRPLAETSIDEFSEIMRTLEMDAVAYLQQADIPKQAIQIDARVDMRYRGQGFEIEVPLPIGDLKAAFDQLPALFAKRYRDIFHIELGEPLEIVSWKVEASGPEPTYPALHHPATKSGDATQKGAREAWFPEAGGTIECPVYNRYTLGPGDRITGPALVEEHESTCLLDIGDTAVVDAGLNLIVTIGGGKNKDEGGRI